MTGNFVIIDGAAITVPAKSNLTLHTWNTSGHSRGRVVDVAVSHGRVYTYTYVARGVAKACHVWFDTL